MNFSTLGALCNKTSNLLIIGLSVLPLWSGGRELMEESATLSIEELPGAAYRVSIIDPIQPSQSLEYELIPKGEAKNENTATRTIPIPAEKIVSLSTTYIGPLNAIGALEQVIAVDDVDYVFSERIGEMHANGEVIEVGAGNNLDLESVIAAKPDLVILTRINSGQEALETRLRDAGIPVLVTASWKETEPLGRSEWIKLFGIITGHREEAFALFEETQERYHELEEIVSAASPDQPKVLLSAPFGGIWYMPGGASFTAAFLEDAGAQSLWKDNSSTGSFPIDFESALAKGFTADFWLNPGRYATLNELATSDERFRSLPVFQAGEVYNRNLRVRPSGANDFWESGSVYPDRVLADLIAIFHPELLPGHEFTYYQRLP
ncbi:ABC transporter substrate-binding protein [Puniceicoccus vermicola]|uniref:ABC transporter substrate-binding protein n=1 Tax=Puniceicoccus vermicola TaxID=388746 RepID=A0A7X1AXQ2_9BACT|nr:ABC transporter substrate-binding protein [Puniceicoccus vermicola]MBC2601931.1 ABC transporter substrate-binding protein [Puniceicoccus vermicola]